MDNFEILKIMKEALEDKKSRAVTAIDISEISSVADYFLIGEGDNIHQLRAMSDEINERLSKIGVNLKQSEGYEGGYWILLDYGDIVVHLFDRESHALYDLERIWADGKKVAL